MVDLLKSLVLDVGLLLGELTIVLSLLLTLDTTLYICIGSPSYCHLWLLLPLDKVPSYYFHVVIGCCIVGGHCYYQLNLH